MPRPLIEALTEAKNISELMVDLAFGGLFYDDAELAREVLHLETELASLLHEMARTDAGESIVNLIGAIELIGRQAVDIAKILLRGLGIPPALRARLASALEVVHRVAVAPDAPLAGRRLADLRLPQTAGMRVLAVRRSESLTLAPGGNESIEAGDVVVARGSPGGVGRLRELAGAAPVDSAPAAPSASDVDRAAGEVVEMKNLAEVSVGLAYAALLYDDRDLATEVNRLEDRLDEMRDSLEAWVLQTARDVGESEHLRGLLHLAVCTETLADAAQAMVSPVERGEPLHPILREALRQSADVSARATVEAGSEVEGRSLSELELRTYSGFTVLAMRREGRWQYRPASPTVLRAGDELLLVGPSSRRREIPSWTAAGAPSLTELEDRIRSALHDRAALEEAARAVHPADVASVIDRLPPPRRIQVFAALTPELAAEVLDELSPDSTRLILATMPRDEAGRLLDLLPMDDAAEVLSEDVPDLQEELLARMRAADAREVRDLLAYPPKTAGRIMTERFVRVDEEFSAAQALDHLRRVGDQVETMSNLYTLDHAGRLQGELSLRALVTAPPEAALSTIVRRDVVTVTPETDQEEVARLVARYDFLALPVVTDEGRMLGVVTVDDVIDVLVEESSEDVLRFGGVEGGAALNQPYFTVPILRVIVRRFWWLLLLFVAETSTGTVLRHFEHELEQAVALAFFVPLLIGTGGNTGAQTVSTLIRGIALGQVVPRDVFRVIRRELSSGLLLGLMLGLVGYGRALLWDSPPSLALVVAMSVVAICTWANTVAALIPLIAHRFRVDPAVVSAPLITTLVDATGLAIYLLIARALLNL